MQKPLEEGPTSRTSVRVLPARRQEPRDAPQALDAAVVRLVLRALLFDGSSVPAWHDDAACASRPRSMFFAEADGVRPRASTVRAAKRICHGCPVRTMCLDDVMAHESPTRRYGVVAGLSPAERGHLRRSTLEVSS